jgi:hypothetical protein
LKKILLTTTALHQPWNEGDWDMTDGNTYAINKHLDERDEWDALQEVTAELEYWREEADLGWDKAEERRAELEIALEALEKLARLGNGDHYGNSEGNMIARSTLAVLKG